MKNYNNYPDNCIHLHACRRICKIYKIQNRDCNKECTAYETEQDLIENSKEYYTRNQVEAVLSGACYDGQNGYNAGDLLLEDYI